MLSLKSNLSSQLIYLLFVVLLYVLVFYSWGQENLYFGYSFVLGVISFPFLIGRGDDQLEYGYLVLALLAAAGAYWSGSFSLFYFTFSFGLCFILSLHLGQINKLPIFLLLIISPLVSHISAMLSFPIRLQLSNWVSTCLQAIGFDIVSEGNLLIISGARFLVDQECVGLKMLITGMVLILIILAYFERKTKQRFTVFQIGQALAIGFVFNVLANFSRILILVLFQIGPDEAMHEIIGVLCLLFYNLLPLVMLIRLWKPAGMPLSTVQKSKVPYAKSLCYISSLTLLLSLAGWSIHQQEIPAAYHLDNSLLSNLHKEALDDNIMKYSSADLLIYVKPPVSPLRGTHDPRFCWRGSGYELKMIKQEQNNGMSIYTGELIKGQDKLYTAWWYQDGDAITNSEWTWRSKGLLDSKAYAMVNVNADSKANLSEALNLYFADLSPVQ